ncbi:hypothetical protein MTO96_049646 [Rhipicephalus appendiculatus]
MGTLSGQTRASGCGNQRRPTTVREAAYVQRPARRCGCSAALICQQRPRSVWHTKRPFLPARRRYLDAYRRRIGDRHLIDDRRFPSTQRSDAMAGDGFSRPSRTQQRHEQLHNSRERCVIL